MPKFKEWKYATMFCDWAQRQVAAGKIAPFDREAVMESELLGGGVGFVNINSEDIYHLCTWSVSGAAGALLRCNHEVTKYSIEPVPSYATPEPTTAQPVPQQPATTSHDAHYRKIEQERGVSPIEVMEAIICASLPTEFHAIAKRNLNLALEYKYNSRLGEKDDDEKELDKGDNYRFRARNKRWPWET